MTVSQLKTPLIQGWCVVALILIVRGQSTWALRDHLEADPDAYWLLATNLQEQHEFEVAIDSNHFTYPVPLRAWRPPLYPCLLAAIIPRGSVNFPLYAGGIQILLGTLTVLAVYGASRRCGLSKPSATLAAGLVLFDPILINQSAEIMTETLAALLVTPCLIALTVAGEDPNRRKWPMLAGAALGAAILCRPTFLVWAVLVAGAFAWIERHRRQRYHRVLLLCLTAAVIVLPWGVRNWIVVGRPFVTTTHGGYTFLRANNPMYYKHLRTSPWGTVWDSAPFDRQWKAQLGNLYRVRTVRYAPGLNPSQIVAVPAGITPQGKTLELVQDRESYKQGFWAIYDEPGMFLYASALRLSRLFGCIPWRTDPNETARTRQLRYAVGAFYLIEFALALVGIATLGRKLFAPPCLWGTLLVLSFALVHTFYWTDMRMRAPLVPVIAMVAAIGVERVWSRVRIPLRP